MSNTFKLSRLSLVLKSHLVEHKQRYLYYLAGMFFIGLVIMLLVVSTHNFASYGNVYTVENKPYATDWEVVQTVIYLSGLAIFALIFSSVSFVNFNNKGEAIFYLIKPASQFEKWLTEIIVHVFLFFAAYTLIFYLVDIPMTILVRSLEYDYFLEQYKEWDPLLKANNRFHPSDFFHFGMLYEDFPLIYPICISLYLTGTAFFMYGAVLFNRFSFFKTLFLAFVTAIAYVIYAIVFFKNYTLPFMPEGWTFQSLLKATYSGTEGYFAAELPEQLGWGVLFFFMAFVPAVLFACSYFKLKEKEV